MERAEPLDEHPDGTAAREADRERILVRVAEAHDSRLPVTTEDGSRLLDDRALDAASRDRPRDLAGIADGHRRSRIAGSRALHPDDTGERDGVPLGAPTRDLVADLVHSQEGTAAASSPRRAAFWRT